MAKSITIAGNLLVDQIKYIQQYPAPHTLTTIESVRQSMGGLACNCAADLARIAPDIPVRVIGLVGGDDAGDYILETLSTHPSIDVSGVLRAGATSFTDVMTQPDGSRTFFQFRGANALLAPEHFHLDAEKTSLLHVGYILLLDTLDGPDPDYPTAMCRVLDSAQKLGIRTSIDVVSEDSQRYAQLVPPALRYADYCIINEIEAERTTGVVIREGTRLNEDAFVPCLERLATMGVGRWIVIHAPEMSCGLNVASRQIVRQPSWKTPPGFIKSSVGAGDAYASGILLGAYQDWPLDKAMRVAGAVAAYSLKGDGASDALRPLSEILHEMEAYQ